MSTRTLTLTVALATLAGQAFGQNALGNGTEMSNRILGDRARNGLGDGRGLDLNPLVGSLGRNNQVRDFQSELRFRNSIVTGNAPNGLSFRGDLPYYAPNDFRAPLGSNDLYSFRRDSLNSGLAGMGIRGTEALQQQFALQTGARPPETISGSLSINRSGASDPDFAAKIRNSLQPMGLAPNQDPSTLGKVEPASLNPDFSGMGLGGDIGQELGTLRSTSAYTATRGAQQTLLDIRTTPNQDIIGVSASTLRGIQSNPLGKASTDNSLAGARNAMTAGASNTTNPAGRNPSTGPLTSPVAKTEAAIGSSAYTDIMNRLSTYAGGSQQGGTAADARPDWQKALDALRQDLSTADMNTFYGTNPAPAGPNFTGLGPGSDGLGGTDLDGTQPAEAPAFTPTAVQPLPPVKNYRFDPSMVSTLRSAGEVSALLPLTDASDSAYAAHMRIAQSELTKGRFFDAEEEFTRALASRPDDAMAIIGRVHAQLGAGTYLSAWMNLRDLLKDHPEMIGVKYSQALLPDAQRLADVQSSLRDLIGRQGPLHRESSLLLAYIGFQSGDAKALEDGLAAMERAKEGQADALTDLLTAVWSGKEPPPAPAAPGADAAPEAPAEPEK